jgi:hypothetical protein
MNSHGVDLLEEAAEALFVPFKKAYQALPKGRLFLDGVKSKPAWHF